MLSWQKEIETNDFPHQARYQIVHTSCKPLISPINGNSTQYQKKNCIDFVQQQQKINVQNKVGSTNLFEF